MNWPLEQLTCVCRWLSLNFGGLNWTQLFVVVLFTHYLINSNFPSPEKVYRVSRASPRCAASGVIRFLATACYCISLCAFSWLHTHSSGKSVKLLPVPVLVILSFLFSFTTTNINPLKPLLHFAALGQTALRGINLCLTKALNCFAIC